MIPRLLNWAVVVLNPFAPPEVPKQVRGTVYDHPKHKDGSEICTSYVVACDKRIIETSSGTKYLLEQPHPDYVRFMKENKIAFDPENPIKMKDV
jgi:hypothetical protein